MSAKTLLSLLLLLSVCSCALVHPKSIQIGFISVEGDKLATLEETDPAFALTKNKIQQVLQEHMCKIRLPRLPSSVAYQMVQGIKFNIIYNTTYGQVHIVAITKYWQQSVSIQQLSFHSHKINQNLIERNLSNSISKQNEHQGKSQSEGGSEGNLFGQFFERCKNIGIQGDKGGQGDGGDEGDGNVDAVARGVKEQGGQAGEGQGGLGGDERVGEIVGNGGAVVLEDGN